MNYVDDLLEELNIRLPELAWKLGKLSSTGSRYRLPPGLFRQAYEPGGASSIEEIKSDIWHLRRQKNTTGALYLARRIQQKVNVLVSLCHLESRRGPVENKAPFGLTTLTTRQQWIASLEKEIADLTGQRDSLEHTIEQKKRSAQTEIILSLQAELGQIEKHLTKLQEELKRGVS